MHNLEQYTTEELQEMAEECKEIIKNATLSPLCQMLYDELRNEILDRLKIIY